MARSERRRSRAPRAAPGAQGGRAREARPSTSGEAVAAATVGSGSSSGVRPAAQKRRFSPFGWLRRFEPRAVADVISELRKVTWPTAAETRYLTFVVAVVAIAVGIVLGVFDLFFGWAIEQVFFN